MKKRVASAGKTRRVVPLIAGSVAMFAMGGAAAGFDVVFHDGDDDYQVCQVSSISHDIANESALEIELDPAASRDEKKCELYLDSGNGTGLTFLLPNGSNVSCGFTEFRISADGTIIGKVAEGCFGTMTRQTTVSYDCFIDDETNRAYVLNVEEFPDGFDCDPSVPETVLVGNSRVGGGSAAPVEVTFQAKSSVRILPPFSVSEGSSLRAFASGI